MIASANRRRVLVAVAAVVIALAIVMVLRRRTELYRSFASPAGRYVLVVLRHPQLLPAERGREGETDGVLQLWDASGKVLRQQPVDAPVSAINQVRWSPDRVTVSSSIAWELSPPDR